MLIATACMEYTENLFQLFIFVPGLYFSIQVWKEQYISWHFKTKAGMIFRKAFMPFLIQSMHPVMLITWKYRCQYIILVSVLLILVCVLYIYKDQSAKLLIIFVIIIAIKDYQ